MQLSSFILGHSLLAVVIVCMLSFFIPYIKALYKFVFDGADLRVTFLTVFVMLFGCLVHNLYPYFSNGRLNYFIAIFSKFVPIASFWMLLSCKLVGYKALYTNKPLKSVAYVVVWAMFFFVAFTEVVLTSSSAPHEIIVNKETNTILINKLSELFSYCSEHNHDVMSTWDIVKFSYYAFCTVGIYVFNKLEHHKNANIELTADILAIAILLLCEFFSNSSIQEIASLKLGEASLASLNATLFVSYICSMTLLFTIEAIDVYNCTKLDKFDWKEKMIKEVLEDSKAYRCKPYGKKMKAEIEVLANAILEDFIKNPDYLETLKSVNSKKKDDKFWATLNSELSKIRLVKLGAYETLNATIEE